MEVMTPYPEAKAGLPAFGIRVDERKIAPAGSTKSAFTLVPERIKLGTRRRCEEIAARTKARTTRTSLVAYLLAAINKKELILDQTALAAYADRRPGGGKEIASPVSAETWNRALSATRAMSQTSAKPITIATMLAFCLTRFAAGTLEGFDEDAFASFVREKQAR